MEKNITSYYGFSVNADDFLLPSELQAMNEYQQTKTIPQHANEIVKFLVSSMFSIDNKGNEAYLCIALQLSEDLEINDLIQYDSIIEKELNSLNMLVPRQCHIEWQQPKLFSLEEEVVESNY